MKNFLYIMVVILIGLLIVSCDSTNNPITPAVPGNLFVSSVPSGAQIWINGTNRNKVTPDTIKNLDPAVYNVTLKLQDFKDSTFQVSVSANQTSLVTNVTLVSSIIMDSFGPIRIWETTGTTAARPSGLDLSTANAYGISSADKDKIDIYYYSSSSGQTYLVQSADQGSGMTRVTKFKVGSGRILNDGLDSPLSDGTWTTNMSDRELDYVFLFDNDQHYSKIKITSFGGGNPNDPAWVEVTWFYNRIAQDRRF